MLLENDRLSKSFSLIVLFAICLRPQFAGGNDRIIDFILFLIILLISVFKRIRIRKEYNFWLVLNFLSLALMLLSFSIGILKGNDYHSRDLFEVYRPLYNILLFLIGSILYKDLDKDFHKLIFVLITCELAIMFFQYTDIFSFNSTILSKLYSDNKVNTYNFRLTGSKANPNTSGVYLTILFFFLYIRIFSAGFKKVWHPLIFITFHIICILFTSSRTALISTIIVYSIVSLLNLCKVGLMTSLKKYFKLVIIIFLTLFVILWDHLVSALNYFKYFREITNVSSILEIRSIQLRLSHFYKLLEGITNSPIFGNGAMKEIFDVGDNDLLFTLWKWGVVGTIIIYSSFVFLLIKSYSIRHKYLGIGVTLSITIIALASLTLDSFHNYNFISLPIILSGYLIRNFKTK